MNEDAFGIVRAGYDRLGERYRKWSADDSVRLQQVKHVMSHVPAGSAVLELGCGPGEPVTRLLTERYRVLAVDASRVQLTLARRAAFRATLLQADMTRLRLRSACLDAVVSFYALGHVPPERHRDLLLSIAAWLRPGGFMMMSYPTGPDSGTEADWLGVPMFFGGLDEEATRAAVDNAGLQLHRARRVRELETGGRTVEFLWLSATKPTVG